MGHDNTTCWTLIRLAAEGSEVHRSEFGRRYLPLVRAFFRQRWRGWRIAQETEDAVQDVFLECCREQGVLDKAEPGRGGFRAFLLGAAHNVARRYEERAGKRRECSPEETAFLQDQPGREARLSTFFDRKWAESMMAEAASLMERRAKAADEDALSRFELLRLRFEHGLPIREIAARWDVPPRRAHDAYAKARKEYYRCLRETVALHGTASGSELDAECRRLLDHLG